MIWMTWVSDMQDFQALVLQHTVPLFELTNDYVKEHKLPIHVLSFILADLHLMAITSSSRHMTGQSLNAEDVEALCGKYRSLLESAIQREKSEHALEKGIH